MKVRKAVIPAAGLGTRMLPASKSVPKEMLPMVDKPVLQYIVEEAVAAGIEDILIITNRGKGAMDDYFDYYPELERRLTERGTDSPDKIQKRLLRAKVEFQTAHTYDYFVINDNIENAVRELDAIMTAEHCKPKERMEIINGN